MILNSGVGVDEILFHRALQRREGAPFGESNRIYNALWGKRLRKIAEPTPEFRIIAVPQRSIPEAADDARQGPIEAMHAKQAAHTRR